MICYHGKFNNINTNNNNNNHYYYYYLSNIFMVEDIIRQGSANEKVKPYNGSNQIIFVCFSIIM